MSSIKVHPLIIKLFSNIIFPIGKVEIFYDDKDYSNYLGFTWERVALERSPIGYNPNSADGKYKTIGEKFGEEKHALTSAENGPHSHQERLVVNGVAGGGDVYAVNPSSILVTNNSAAGTFGSTAASGNGSAHNTIHPVEVMAFWRRVA